MSIMWDRLQSEAQLVSAELARPANTGRPGCHTAPGQNMALRGAGLRTLDLRGTAAGLASPHAHQSDAIADILAVMGHGAGGETPRRLLARLGVVVSGDTVLRHLKRRAQRKPRAMLANSFPLRPKVRPLKEFGSSDRQWAEW